MTRYIDADALTAALKAGPNIVVNALVQLVAQQPTVSIPLPPPITVSPPPTADVPAYRVGKRIVFGAPYSDARNWTSGKTSAFPGGGSGYQVNPGDSKLDRIGTVIQRPSDAGVFTATPSAGAPGRWDTQLVTTEYSPNGFKVQTGDVVAFDFTPSATLGAWPAVWTWKDGGNEVDFFEYHGDNPNTAEFTNHVNGGGPDYPKVFTPGRASHVEVVCGATSVDWYVDGVKVFGDGVGVPKSWSAYLIVNLSIQAPNQYHPGPAAGTGKITATIANVKVYR